MGSVEAAIAAIERGEVVIYPTETVYGLGADPLDPDAIERVFAAKSRDRDRPISMGVPDLATAEQYVRLDEHERAFGERFLPGPVTLVARKRSIVPDALTGGRDRVGIRVPDHPRARDLLGRAGPLTATSANPSGDPAPTTVAEIDREIESAAAAVLDGCAGSGDPSTVVDLTRDEIIRPGADADAVREWLQSQK
ncbi:MAG: L-threonylcarbamoyladenylate synthase [Halococcoides sp.]